MKVKSNAEILAVISPIAQTMQIEIVDLEFKQGRMPALTIFIDTEKGVDLDTCEAFHRAIDSVLDELDPTFGAEYTLNVSSPGLDRPLKTERDFKKAMQQKVEVKLYAHIKGVKYLEGVLCEYDGNCVTIQTDKDSIKLPLTQVAKINKAIEFNE